MTDDLTLSVAPIDTGSSLKVRIYESLKSAIMAMNIYDEDAQLRLDERNLAEQFGISRTPLREALARLDQEGLIDVVPRRGIFIVRKSKVEILEMITVWAALESMAARIITLEALKPEIATLRQMFGAFEEASPTANIDEYSDANIRFHQAIIAMAKNETITRITDGFIMHVQAIRHRTIFDADRARKSIVEHMDIIGALEKRETDRAARLVREHTFGLRDHVAQNLDLDF